MKFISQWWKKRIENGNAALPDNLKGKLHTDWMFPFNKIPRAATSFKWQQPPILLIGKNVKRWDTAEPKEEDVLNNYPFGRGWILFKNRPILNNKSYGANAIQKILGEWTFGFHVTWPLGIHAVFKLWKYKEPTQEDIARGYDGVRMIYLRFGVRWDSWDDYYTFPSWFIGGTFN